METISTFIVPVDASQNSERAIALTAHLAAKIDADAMLLHAATSPDERKLRKLRFSELTNDQIVGGVHFAQRLVLSDDPAGVILDEAHDGAMVVMATAGTIAPHSFHIGSVAEKVVRNAAGPIILVGPHCSESFTAGQVVVSVDGSALSERSLPVGGMLSKLFGLPLWVVTVISPEDAQDAAAAGVTAEHGYVKRLADRLTKAGYPAEFEVLHGPDVADSLLAFVGDNSLSVMSTHGRTGLRRLLMGSVTSDAVRHSTSPVVAIGEQVSKRWTGAVLTDDQALENQS